MRRSILVSILLSICRDVGRIAWRSSVDTFSRRSSIHIPLRSTLPCEVTYISWLIRILLRVMLLLWNSTALMNFPSPSLHLTLSFSLYRIFSIFPTSVASIAAGPKIHTTFLLCASSCSVERSIDSCLTETLDGVDCLLLVLINSSLITFSESSLYYGLV